MNCKCNKTPCCCKTKVVSKTGPRGPRGPAGRDGNPIFTVSDNITSVTNVREIRFTDANAQVTDLGAGVVEVNFVPPATVWTDIQNIPWYVGGGVSSFKPQYTIEGNKITFRGLLYIPLVSGGISRDVTAENSYLNFGSAITDDSRLSIITNANTNNGTPQGRFMTVDIVTAKNLPPAAIPQARDIVFNNVPAYRRYTGLGFVPVYRSIVTMRIGSTATVFKNGVTNIGSGCIMVFSPFNDEYDGSGNTPLGNDPLALSISRVVNAATANDYVGATDDNPFTVGAGGANPFAVNAHNVNSLGGFIINLEGLSGYLN
jgi:hypothetical protein